MEPIILDLPDIAPILTPTPKNNITKQTYQCQICHFRTKRKSFYCQHMSSIEHLNTVAQFQKYGIDVTKKFTTTTIKIK